GWRYYPDAKGKRVFCDCRYCNRGQINSGARWRAKEPLSRAPGLPTLLAKLHATTESSELQSLLDVVARQWGRDAEQLRFLMSHADTRVLEFLVYALGSFRGAAAAAMLGELATHADENVRRLAREELDERDLNIFPGLPK